VAGSKNRRIIVQAGEGTKRDLTSKITKAKGLEMWFKQ
jgi:hypothetical protein